MSVPTPSPIRLGLPKGRMEQGVFQLLADAGIGQITTSRGYRPGLALPGFETKILKPQNIVEMLHRGSRDLGFAGRDWVIEKGAELVEVVDTELDPVRIVAAAPRGLLVDGKLPPSHPDGRRWLVATEYVESTREWIERTGLRAEIVRSYGATEVFPPEDADFIVDNAATGSTLVANGLFVFDELMRSSTRLFANPVAWADPAKRPAIDHVGLLLTSVLSARKRVMVEVNVVNERLDEVIAVLPCMKEPTVSRLHHEAGYAVKAAVPKKDLAQLIPVLKAAGATDIVVSALSQIVP